MLKNCFKSDPRYCYKWQKKEAWIQFLPESITQSSNYECSSHNNSVGNSSSFLTSLLLITYVTVICCLSSQCSVLVLICLQKCQKLCQSRLSYPRSYIFLLILNRHSTGFLMAVDNPFSRKALELAFNWIKTDFKLLKSS